MVYVAAAVVLAVLLLLAAVLYRRLRKRPIGNGKGKVTALSDHRKRKQSVRPASESAPKGQKCSYCRKPSKRLTFYADEAGTVVGVCPACKHLARERDLMPL